MPAVLGGFEDYGAIELWNHPGYLVVVGVRVAVQFEQDAPLALPVGVEVNDQVQSTVRVRDRMAIEIDVRVQRLAVAVVVRAAAEIVRVVEQVGYAGDAGDQPEEILRLDERIESGIGRAQRADPLEYRLAPHLSVFVDGVAGIELRKFRKQGRRNIGLQEAVDHNMTEWLALLELFRGGRQPCRSLVGDHGYATLAVVNAIVPIIACP